ncbi:MAG: alanine--tRNA ligase-related protein [Oscillospiraceae bacterium]|nr:alanine--tRNA ligase-related protein [Oscillospiraceae bacterium]
MTEKLYEQDSYCREFKATVISCDKNDEFYNVVLDKTAFFPEGGGQAADKGTINDIEVLDVQIKDDVISHKTQTPVSVGQEVTCKIDWELRFSRMQSHAGEHIVSGVVNSLFGYSNVGFHMGEAVMTVDFSGTLSAEDIAKVELKSNKAIYSNAPITVSYPSVAELKELQYRSKIEPKEGTRLVTIGDVDCCACCAPHPAKTGEIGLIKIINFYPHKQGTRVEMLAGINALNDYAALNESNKSLMGMLSAPRQGVKEAVLKQNELLNTVRSENQKLSRELALCKLNPIKIGSSVYSITEGFSFDDLRFCANNLIDSGVEVCVLLSLAEEQNYNYVVSSKTTDIRDIAMRLNKTFNGKGGGKPDYVQGKLSQADSEELKKIAQDVLK